MKKTTMNMRKVKVMATLLAVIMLVTSINPIQAAAATSDPVERIWFVGNYDKSVSSTWYDGMKLKQSDVAKIGLVVKGQTKSGKIKNCATQVKEVGQYLYSKNGTVKLTVYYENGTKTISLKVGVKIKKISLKATGSSLYEGQVLTTSMARKVAEATVTYNNKKVVKKSKAVVCQQVGKTIKANKKGKFKLTFSLGKVKKSIWINVKPIKRIYIGKTKVLNLTEGTEFLQNSFKGKTTVKSVYTNGVEKTLKTYSVSASRKVTGKKFLVTVKYGKLTDKISIPVVKPNYKVSVKRATGGTFTIDGKETTSKTVVSGSSIILVAKPETNYQFTGWFVDGVLVSTSATYKLTVVKNVTLTPSFTKKEAPKPEMFTVTLSKEGEGVLTMNGEEFTSRKVADGTEAIFDAKASEGYELSKLEVNGEAVNGTSFKKTIEGDINVKATFVKKEEPPKPTMFTVNVGKEGNGEVELVGYADQVSVSVEAETKVTAIATPAEGSILKGWKINGILDESAPSTIVKTITSDMSFVAVFEEKPVEKVYHTVTIVKEGEGVVTIDRQEVASKRIEAGTETVVDLTPAEGWKISEVEVDGEAVSGDTFSKTVNKDLEVKVVFVKKTHTLTVKSNGVVKLGKEIIQFKEGVAQFQIAWGEKVALTPENTEHLLFGNWKVNGQHVSSPADSYEFVMSEDIEVEACFYEWYTIGIETLVEGGSASVTNLSESGKAQKDQMITLAAKPLAGYEFVDWTDGEGNVLGTELELVHRVTGDIAIRPNFKKIEYAVSVEGLGEMGIDGTTETSKMVPVGETARVSYNDSEHFKFLRWEDENGNMVSLEKEYSFVVTENTHLIAVVDEYYQLSVKATNGIVNLEEEDVTGTARYYQKGIHTLVLTLNEGYQLVNWTDSEGNDLGCELELEIELDADKEITAVIEKIRCNLVVSESSGGTTTINGNDATERTYAYGTDVTLNTTANPGYKFVRWVDKITGKTLSENKEYSFSIKSDMEIVPVFDRVYTVTVTRKGRGTVKFNGEELSFSNNVANVSVPAGRYTIETEDNDDYYFVKYVVGKEEVTKSSYSVAVANDIAVEVNLAERIKTARVSYQDPYNGQVYLSSEVTRGETLVAPNDKDKIVRSNHTFEGWILNDTVYKGQLGDDDFYADEQRNQSLSDAVKALTKDGTDVVIYASFVPIKTKFTVSVKGGTVKTVSADDGIVDGSLEVEINSMVSISANVPDGKCWSHWEDSNGNYLHNIQDFTIEKVTSNMDYVAVFADTEPEREPMVYFMAKDGVKGYKGEGNNWYFNIACNIPDDGRFSKIEWGIVVASKVSSDDELIAHASNVSTNPDGNPDTQTALGASLLYRITFNSNWISQKRTVRLKVYADIQPKDGESYTIYSEECLHVDLSRDDPQIESF